MGSMMFASTCSQEVCLKLLCINSADQEGMVSLASRRTLTLQTQQPMENTLQYVPGSRLVLLANFLGNQLTVLLLSASLNAFSSVTLIDLTEPVFCFDYVQPLGEQDEAVKVLPSFPLLDSPLLQKAL